MPTTFIADIGHRSEYFRESMHKVRAPFSVNYKFVSLSCLTGRDTVLTFTNLEYTKKSLCGYILLFCENKTAFFVEGATLS